MKYILTMRKPVPKEIITPIKSAKIMAVAARAELVRLYLDLNQPSNSSIVINTG
jgi:hypothetical protein